MSSASDSYLNIRFGSGRVLQYQFHGSVDDAITFGGDLWAGGLEAEPLIGTKSEGRGIDGEGFVYVGDSQIFDSQGEPMAENVGGETIVRTELSAIKLAQQRDRFPVLDDADEFVLKL